MANSSDWIALAGSSARPQPTWIGALAAESGFAPLAPFAAQGSPPNDAESAGAKTPQVTTETEIATAFAEGLATGRAQAEVEAGEQLAAQRAIRMAFRDLDAQALDVLASDLAQTVLALCGQVIDEQAIDRDALAARCRAAAQRIGAAASHCVLRLHPDDLALIEPEEFDGITLQPDSTLERGSITLQGPDGAVRDGPAQWRRAIAEALQP